MLCVNLKKIQRKEEEGKKSNRRNCMQLMMDNMIRTKKNNPIINKKNVMCIVNSNQIRYSH